MKLKGRRELLAEEVYDIADKELRRLTIDKYREIKLDDINDIDSVEKSYDIMYYILKAKSLVYAIFSGDFSIEQLEGIKRALEIEKGLDKLVQIMIDRNTSENSLLVLLEYFNLVKGKVLDGNETQ